MLETDSIVFGRKEQDWTSLIANGGERGRGINRKIAGLERGQTGVVHAGLGTALLCG